MFFLKFLSSGRYISGAPKGDLERSIVAIYHIAVEYLMTKTTVTATRNF